MTTANSSSLRNKLQWQCRRGMLELDVILIPFLERHFDQLQQAEQNAFCELLRREDPDLYTWIMGNGECSDEALKPILQIIRERLQVA